ncbi:hypothetical protein B0T24DRAFT_401679 [Lasiosphaeria ovina]|uniref:Major facilitator superfamily transporter n=1 Tax=Lasiosphaeria ovina TaxID=92902 RepID=A0AAE0JWW8_9PEZI|nr:hypothetical protein B0T24DRAFT_401679 [Lasiosphaeria ovina]
MEGGSFLGIRKSTSLTSILSTRDEKLGLPLPAHQQQKIRVRTILGHCLYRRVLLWSAAVLFFLFFALSRSRTHVQHGRVVDFAQGETENVSSLEVVELVPPSEVQAKEKTGGESDGSKDAESHMPHWLRFRHLDGYFNGIKAMVSLSEHRPEFPRKKGEKSPFPLTVTYKSLPTPTPFVPQPDYKSPEYTSKYHAVEPCYLDKDEKVPVPDLYAYSGVVQGMPLPAMGSHSLLGLRDDICFDRFGRYGPYGLGYGFGEGGVEVGTDTENESSQTVWSKGGKINYDNVDWGDAQTRCLESNKKRFVDPVTEDDQIPEPQSSTSNEPEKITRTAIVVRTYVGFPWSQHTILNFRAMISELSLRSGGEYAVHFLLHIRSNDEPIWANPATAQHIMDENVPYEFHSICTLWSEAQMRLIYPGRFGSSVANPSNGDIHGVYRSAHMPLQNFAANHPEYTHFWNWEMDMRWLGNYYELFDRLATWARNQSRIELWERSQKYYIPNLHGSWENFSNLVHQEMQDSGRKTILGPVRFAGQTSAHAGNIIEEENLPASCTNSTNMSQCGVGEEADLITFNPIFDAEESGWVFASDVTGYDSSSPTPPRRCAIITASRLSRRLLMAMHEETWKYHHTMFSEMFPASVALHHGFKAVYAPHPVYLDRGWDLESVDEAFNGGRDHSTSRHGSPFDFQNEHNHKGSTWYFNSEFAGLLWRRWLGYAQMDGRGVNGGRSGEGTLRGGIVEEKSAASSGRLCLKSVLLHPIKWEHPSEMW